ncbi:eukaryotic translation initiation factor 2-alpha kinase [Spiromyces aspiralis]|uniref:Eukaryotic translation initiation factor 2-alpha kinase n=1 Tax=Spiromyces aspiralis TaxID=68401 RepID=A0ACC1HLM4_9FUNG|nr:eukaryotic translation initiation factor 2-alpha kinase [Spiromyces aspiralis]
MRLSAARVPALDIVSRDELCPWLFSKIQERYQIDCVIHETKSTTKVSTGSMTSASLAHLFEPMMISKEHQQLIASSSGSNSILGNIPVSVPEQQHSSLVLASDERRFEVVFVDPNQAGKNLNRVKAKQKSMLTDRATGNVKKALGELRTNAPIIIVPLNSTAIRKLLGMESILGEEGFKKIMEGSSAHQRVHITRLRSQLERFKRQGSKLVWLYSSPDDYAVTYKM